MTLERPLTTEEKHGWMFLLLKCAFEFAQPKFSFLLLIRWNLQGVNMPRTFGLLGIQPNLDSFSFQITPALLRDPRETVRFMNRYPFDPHSFRPTLFTLSL